MDIEVDDRQEPSAGTQPQRGADAKSQRERSGRRTLAEGRGRLARAPHQIPPRGLLDVVWRVYRRCSDEHVSLLAAGVAFYAILSLVPGLLALVSIYGLVVEPEQARAHIQSLAGVLPWEARSLLMDEAQQLIRSAESTLGWSAVLGVVTALWSSSSATRKLMVAVGVLYEEPDGRSFVRARWQALWLTALLNVACLVSLLLIALPSMLEPLHLPDWLFATAVHARWLPMGAVALGSLAVVYDVAPDRANARWGWVSWGAVLATLLWLSASSAFALYVSHFGHYGETYGALAGIVVLMLWTYLTALVVLLGASLNAELEAQTAVDTTVGRARPMGSRNAVKADSLGPLRGQTESELAREHVEEKIEWE